MELGGDRKRVRSRRGELRRLIEATAQKEGMTTNALLVLSVLWSYAHDDGAAWPTTDHLMRRTLLAESSVKSALRVLRRTHTILSNDDNRARTFTRLENGKRTVVTIEPRQRVVLIYALSRRTPEGLAIEAMLKGAESTDEGSKHTEASAA